MPPGEIITPGTPGQVVADSVRNEVGLGAQANRQADHIGLIPRRLSFYK